MNFLKSLGIGLVIVILLPILLLGAVLVGLVLLVEWIVMFVKGSIRFFKGDSFFEPLPEDLLVQDIKANELNKQINPQPEPAPAPQPTHQNVYVSNYYQYPGQSMPNQNPAPQPQPNPYVNPHPYHSPAPQAIPERSNDFIDEDCQRVQYREAPRDFNEFDVSKEEGGNE